MIGKTLLQILKESTYTTVLSGYAMLEESGYPAIRDGEASYDIEQKYGYSADEMFSSSFYSTRTEQFFRFYRDEILSALDKPPGKCFYEMAELERRGLIHSIITRRVFGLPESAGCRNVINLHGSVYENYCQRCGRKYPVEYIRNSSVFPSARTATRPSGPKCACLGRWWTIRLLQERRGKCRRRTFFSCWEQTLRQTSVPSLYSIMREPSSYW